MSAHAQRLAALFAGNPAAHGTHGEPAHNAGRAKWEIKGTARTIKSPVTAELWEQHIAGVYPLGIIAIRPDSTCQWGCIDIDEYQEDLLRLIQQINAARHPLVPCRSKSGGLHLFLFLTEPQPAIGVITLLRAIAARLGHATAEIFPKQATVHSDRGDVGNWIIVPYFGSTYGGKLREQVGLKHTGAEMTLEEFLAAAEAARITPSHLRSLTSEPAPASTTPGATRKPFGNGPPCLQILSENGFTSNRNETLTHAGIYAKRARPNDWRQEIERYNQEYCKPPLPADEVLDVIHSLEKKDYEYFCKRVPMSAHCNSALCRSRKYGVGADGDYPRISSISKLDNDPTWFMEVDDMRLMLTTEQLQTYWLFHRVALEHGCCYRAMKQDAWFQALRAAMENLVLIESSPDVSVRGVFHEYLEDFLTNKRRGKQRDDLLSDRPWEDEEQHRHYFTLKALVNSLRRQGVRDHDLRRSTITQNIKELGGGPHFFNLKGKGINVWWVPSSSVSPTPTPDPPPLPAAPI